ncbi:MAG: GNAT family N-acetyltransferase [Candidatus Dormibacteraceae bacterium]
MRGWTVELREISRDDAALMRRWSGPEFTGEFNDLGPLDEAVAARLMVSRMMVMRCADGEPIGTMSWHLVSYGPNQESRAWNMGINLIPAARGHGYGTEAQRLLAEHLLATTDVNRVEAATDVANAIEQRSLEKAGLHREGVLRGAQFRAGDWHDLVVYSMIRADLARPT